MVRHSCSQFQSLIYLHAKIIIVIVGIPRIVQCDNGNEFKGALLILLQRYSIQVINSRPQHPQSQGLVEQANGVMKRKIHCWVEEHEGYGWSDALPEIALGMNRQTHSTLRRKMPYEVFFNRKPRWEDRALRNSSLDQTEIEIWDQIDQLRLEDQEEVMGEDIFPNISGMNIFDAAKASMVRI